MRALCSVRGPLGAGERGYADGTLGGGTRLAALRVPGHPQPLHFVVEAKARARDLRTRAHSHHNLRGMLDTDLFGLAVVHSKLLPTL